MTKVEKSKTLQKSGLRGYIVRISDTVFDLLGVAEGHEYTMFCRDGALCLTADRQDKELYGDDFITYGSRRVDGKLSIPPEWVAKHGWQQTVTKLEKYLEDVGGVKIVKLVLA